MRKATHIFLIFSMLWSASSMALSSETDELDVIELELDRAIPRVQGVPSSENTATSNEEAPVKKSPSDFSSLGKLAAFKEISVIQKRFLPKTGRFQLFGGGTILTNNPFFLTAGGVAKFSYFVTESWGLELNYFGLSTSERTMTQELRDIQGVNTQNLVYPKSFLGADFMYVPVYGKMAWFNESIIPFDLYFSLGLGTTKTQSDEAASTVHLAAGQIFALNKAFALRWDFSWNFFDAKGIDGAANSFNNLFLTVGLSWFFPEAGYR